MLRGAEKLLPKDEERWKVVNDVRIHYRFKVSELIVLQQTKYVNLSTEIQFLLQFKL